MVGLVDAEGENDGIWLILGVFDEDGTNDCEGLADGCRIYGTEKVVVS